MSWDGFVFAYLPGETAAVPAGTLALEEQGLESLQSTFGYGKRYLVRPNAIPVDPHDLPLTCLPGDQSLYQPKDTRLFGAFRDAAPDAWGRRVIEAIRKVPANSLPESEYLLNAGSNRFGALDFRTDSNSLESDGVLPPMTELEYLLDAADRVQEGLDVPARYAHFFAGGTLGGARPKAIVLHKGRQYIAKFPAKNDTFNQPVVEHAVLELARKADLDVPETELVTLSDGRQVLLVERFDRTPTDQGFERRHCVSALSMLGRHEGDSLGTPYGLLADAIGQYGAAGRVKQDRRELFRRIAFNVLVSNDDDHLRNHAFVWDAVGKGWQLSPLYDVVPRPQVAEERFLHMGVGPQGRLATLDNLFAAHGTYGLLAHEAMEALQSVSAAVRGWTLHFEELGVPPAEIDKVSSAFRRPSQAGLPQAE